MQSLLSIIEKTELMLPALEVLILIGLLTLSLLSRLHRCGMITAYLFSYRWCWSIVTDLPESAQIGYIVFGMLVGVLSVIGMLTERHPPN